MSVSLSRGVVLGVVVLWAAQVRAADISGSINATFEGFNEFGVPSVKLDLNLSCALTCPPSAPTLHFGVAGGVGGKFAADPTTTAGYTSAFFGSDPTGVNSVTTTSFPVGSAFSVLAKSATCWCGNANGQGGFIDLQTGTVTIPPRLLVDATARMTDTVYVNVFARPMGSDTVDVWLQGAGFDEVRTIAATTFGGSSSSGSAQVIFQPKQPGTISVTATLQPYGTASAVSQIVIADNTATGGGSGSTGGGSGSGGGGSDTEPSGCATTPGLMLAAVALLLAKRRG